MIEQIQFVDAFVNSLRGRSMEKARDLELFKEKIGWPQSGQK
jgi:hypothetical protein